MRTIKRRELSHHSGAILDEVIKTGEPVRVTNRDGEAVIISKEPVSLYEQWARDGLIEAATPSGVAWADLPTLHTDLDIHDVLDELRGDY
ncbi:antitoxin Phd_YefM of type II toxin-antitoxin system [Branchiibius hedensis]|uniref:Antitoxin n=1 Tax=Branchiibius hedensis TaxID=672460 RepID=A0A2Y8ZUV0_9MICO|nr:type II toxin-antitoxin system Phd/YefM family antitoxin [Branchiibius hedensis]PWJ26904.1 antitoxin Phd_YefM of type II toxin-antitoxin system [Branchiibius hedensis]SSA35715.1 Antitoxin Phd_YefM, type II toxin-antitoxin system [Branchiibius hedensis]